MSKAGKLAWGFIVLLGILHWDFWFWGDRTLAFGFLPVGLLYQAGISVGAALGWALVFRFAWPEHVEQWADSTDEPAGDGGQA